MADFSTEHAACRQPFLNSKASAGVWRAQVLAMLRTYYDLPLTCTESDMDHSYTTDDERWDALQRRAPDADENRPL